MHFAFKVMDLSLVPRKVSSNSLVCTQLLRRGGGCGGVLGGRLLLKPTKLGQNFDTAAVLNSSQIWSEKAGHGFKRIN